MKNITPYKTSQSPMTFPFQNCDKGHKNCVPSKVVFCVKILNKNHFKIILI